MILGNMRPPMGPQPAPNAPIGQGPGPGVAGGMAPQMPQAPTFNAGGNPAMSTPGQVPTMGNPMAGAAPQMPQGGLAMAPTAQQGGLNRQLIQSRMLRGMA